MSSLVILTKPTKILYLLIVYSNTAILVLPYKLFFTSGLKNSLRHILRPTQNPKIQVQSFFGGVSFCKKTVFGVVFVHENFLYEKVKLIKIFDLI